MSDYSSPKGVFDIIPRESSPEGAWRETHLWQYVEEVMRKCAADYGFQEIRTPIFERTELFVRGVGESSDIVSKEMYTFEDKSGRSLTLRPEGTAPVIRAFLEKRLDQTPGMKKYFYIGPMFRYERPQAGRFRQFHQFGYEVIGDASPERDVEAIDFILEIYRRLGLKNLSVLINSVGDEKSRNDFRTALKEFLEPHLSQLSEDSQTRYQKNVLRILDSKDPNDQKLLQGAPSILEMLSPEAKAHFEKVKQGLTDLNIPFQIQPKLVRGLDYYNKTVFEITSGELGAQNSVGGGGRYDGLLKSLGGPDLPAVGFATGLERLIQTMLAEQVPLPKRPHPLIFLVPLGEKAKEACLKIVFNLRHAQIPAEIDLQSKKVGNALQLAQEMGATYALVIGDNELASGEVKIKELSTREEQLIKLSELAQFLKKVGGNE